MSTREITTSASILTSAAAIEPGPCCAQQDGGRALTYAAGSADDNVVGLEYGRARLVARHARERRLAAVRTQLNTHADAGLATAEYAIATIAAAGFAGLLIVILKSGAVQTMLTDIIHSALSVG